jgi:asparagine synthase (glutamine-hydrolysing)
MKLCGKPALLVCNDELRITNYEWRAITMCGFVGFTRRGELCSPEINDIIRNMSSKIAHRGPDGEGYHVTDAVALGFRRLSFLDLEHGEQPMHSPDGALTIVFNGEIYNFMRLREELEAKGRSFATTSDTEVLLALYAEYGAEMLNMLRGMFAFVIYDHRDDSIFAARDYFGIKPFYYGIFDGQLLFASEIKALLPHPAFVKQINHGALAAYLSFQYSVLDETFFQGVHKLPAGHFMRYGGGEIEIERYWQAEFKSAGATDRRPLLDDIVNKIDAVIADSIAAHQVSDVEIGSFLSSGVDSSILAARFGGKKTFTVGFDYEGYNEIDYARELSAEKGLANYAKLITTEEYWQALPKIQYHMDEPLADAAAVALYFVSQTARPHVKGVLSGEGADELFGGYNIYKEPLSLRPIRILPRFIRRLLGKVAAKLPNFKGKNFLIRAAMDVEERFIGNAKVFSEEEKGQILVGRGGTLPPAPKNTDITRPYYDKIKHYDDITKMQYLDLHLWLVGDILLKADKMTMAHSLEGRVPFLDKEVFAVAAQIPTKYRVNKKATKYAFRLAAARHLAPKWAEKRKLGFPVPVRVWLRQDDYYNTVKTAFESSAAREFFNTGALVAMLDAHKAGKADNSRKVWVVYMFLLWYGEFFEA